MVALPIIALFGPTAVGKTAVAIALAQRLRARGEDPVAISVDALQVYAGLELLTGAPGPAETARLEHLLVSSVPLTCVHSAGAHAALAHVAIDDALAAGRRPIVVGGTGLYLRAALAELELRPPPPPGVRERWEAELARRDPVAAAAVHPADRQRVVRALELLDAQQAPPPAGAPQLWMGDMRHPTALVGLTRERGELYRRIDDRVEAMVRAGAAEQVRRALALGASSTARQAIGFAELARGDVESMKRRTRRYAKRQLTWMAKLAGATVINLTHRDPEDVVDEILTLAPRPSG